MTRSAGPFEKKTRSPRRRIAAPAVAAAVLAAAGLGCGPRGLEHRDDPFLARMAADGDRQALQKLHSPQESDRILAVRTLAECAARERAAGRTRAAEHYVELILRRFDEERSTAVRHTIVALAAPVMGRGSPATLAFLRRRLAEGNYAGAAALSLASLAPPEAYGLIVPLTAHPLPATRYQAALALALLGDSRGAGPARRVLDEMGRDDAPPGGDWPDVIQGVPLAEARAGLRARLLAAFGHGPPASGRS